MSEHNDPFGDRNLDHLHQRVASGMPQRPSSVDDAIIAELTDLRNTVLTVTLGSVDQVFRWLMSEIDERIIRRRPEFRSAPHVAAQEDDGDAD
jgi:hypothetical protein